MLDIIRKLIEKYKKIKQKSEKDELIIRFLTDPSLVCNDDLLNLLLQYTSDAKRSSELIEQWHDRKLDFYDVFRLNYKELHNILNVHDDTASLFLLIYNVLRDEMLIAEEYLPDCIDKLQAEMKSFRRKKLCEEAWVVGMNAKGNVQLFDLVGSGDGIHAAFDISHILRSFKIYEIHTIALLHTHPGASEAALSEQDRRATEQMMKIFSNYHIAFGYHSVITEHDTKTFACKIGADGMVVYDYIPDIRKHMAESNP